jgi:hypothetical protein
MVDAAKAFCPECGNPMEIEEQRQVPAEFDQYQSTEKITRSGYEMMIKEMELDISESPPLKETDQEPKLQSVAENSSKSNIWIIMIVAAALAFLIIGILVIAGVFFYMR